MSFTSPALTRAGERALVLGGGGSAGNAWLIGVLAGLADAGLDVTRADLTVGTSAGATAAAQLAGASPAELLAAILDAPPAAPVAARPGLARPTSTHLESTAGIIAASTDAADMRRRMGASAIELADAQGGGERWRAVVASRLPVDAWPERRLLLTAVDAETGEPVVFDRDSGVALVDAVAASCSAASAYGIAGRRCIDGGYRRNENADLAAGYERVLVLSPLSGRTRHPLAWRMQLSAQVEDLRAAGSAVETVLPDEASLEAFGADMMDLSTRPPAARAGYRQGSELAERLKPFWG
ncbi:MAG: hypothetical protein QM713_03995 [Arachnia sp.]